VEGLRARWGEVWRRSLVLRVATFLLAYLGFCEGGDWLTDTQSQFSTFWPAAGLYMGALIVAPRRSWPWFMAAAAVADATVSLHIGRNALLAAATILANPLEAGLGAWLVLRACGGRPRMSRRRDVLLLLLLGAGVAPLAGAVVGGSPVSLRYDQTMLTSWSEWWTGDALGVLIVAPAVLAWTRPAGPGRSAIRARPLEFVALLVAVAGMSWAIFHKTGLGMLSHQYLLLPIMVWAALRFGVRGVTLSGVLLGVVASYASARGPWAGRAGGLVPDAAPLQLLLAVGIGTTLLLASILAEQRRSERALRLARFALDHGSDGFAVIDPEGTITFANEGTGRLVGSTAREVLGRKIWDLDSELPPDRWAERWREIRAGVPVLYETGLSPSPGRRAVTEVGLSYLSFGGQEYGVWAARDVSDRKRAESAQRLASVGTLAAGVAHEINNPLTYVASNLAFVGDLLGRLRGVPSAGDEVAEAETAVREALEGARRVRNIVRDLKFVSRAPDARRVEVDIVSEVRTAINLSQNEIRHRARLVTRLDPVPTVLSSEGQLGQVFVNLLVNAAQAIPEGHPSANEVRISTRVDGDGWAVVEVADTGAGIPAALRARIFEPFFTTKAVGTGTGLGLSICHGIVTSLGGEIELETEDLQGTTFRIRLPPAHREDRMTPVRAAPAPPPLPRARVLVVDDEPLIGKSVARMLGRRHDVVVVTDPRQALARLLAGERFDLVLCDLMMPDLNGMELQRELERRRPGATEPFVFITGGAFTAGAQEFLERSGRTHLQKPFETEALEALLRQRLEVVASVRRPA
jgi:PAS domain S-box-containing protein